ncbi:hypothetical protein Bca101_078954 [Brassica carinata]
MAKVTGIQQDEGWCYIGCSGCSKKIFREISSFTCVTCNETNVVAALVYRVILTVSDATDTAAFLGFDMEVAKLRNIQASKAAQIVGIGVDAQVDTDLPRSFAEIFGNTYTFQLKLKDFNFTSKHQTFTVSCVFPSCTPEAAQPEVVATGSDAKVDNTCCVTEAPSTSDGSLAGSKASAKEQIALDENPP